MQISENIQTNYQGNVNLKSVATSVPTPAVKTNVETQVAKTQASQVQKSEDLAKQINELSSRKEVSVNFQRDEQTGTNIVQFVDSSTRKVIKQFPSEEMVKVIQQIDKFLETHSKDISAGNLLNEVA